jgi:YndJ-like protein
MDNHEILASERLRRHCRYSTFLGVAVWWVVCFLHLARFDDAWAVSMLLLFVPLVLFRLAFPLLVPPSPVRKRRAWFAVSYAQPPAAILLAVSFLLPRGEWAALLALPWLLFTLFLAGIGIDRACRPRRAYGEWGSIAAMLLLPIGAVWAVLFQANVRPLEFSDTIVLLTATHFHYAGFVLPIVAGQLVRHRPGNLTRLVLAGAVVGVPLVAVGITVSQLGGPKSIELAAVALVVVVAVLLATILLRQACDLPALPGVLLGVSALSLLFALGWSALYAAGQAGLLPGVSIPFMVTWHGAVNALGFAFCGLLGWHFLATRPKPAAVVGGR